MKTRQCSSCGSSKYYCKGLCKSCYTQSHVQIKWSKNFDRCVTCEGRGYPHVARGQCSLCYGNRVSNIKCACGCGGYTTLRGTKAKKFIQGHWLKFSGNVSKIKPDMRGNKNPQYGKFGKDHPAFGHSTSQKTRDERRNRRLSAIASRGKTTKIEVVLSEMLDELNLVHNSQTILYDKFSVDEYLPDFKLVIEAYGGYWHGDTRRFPTLSARQTRTTKKDRSKEKYLNTCGHRVLILWENELLNCREWCKDEIRKSIIEYSIPLTQDSIYIKS